MTLKFLNDENILALSTEQIFQRGMKYYQQGRVVDLVQAEGIFQVQVIGTKLYNVSLNTHNFAATCNCPSFHAESWCKHLVALGLTLAHGQIIGSKKPSIKKTTVKTEKTIPVKIDSNESAPKWLDQISPELDQVLSKLSIDDQNRIFRHILSYYPAVEKEISAILVKRTDILDFTKKLKKIVSAVKRAKSIEGIHRQADSLIALLQDQFSRLAQNLEGMRMRLECARQVHTHIEAFAMAQDYIIDKLFTYLSPIEVFLQIHPKEMLDILQEYLTDESYLAEGLLSQVIHSSQAECIEQVHTWIEQSNVRKIAVAQDNELFQKHTMSILAENGRSNFLTLIEECDLIQDKAVYYRQYYQSIEDWTNYLKHSATIDNARYDATRAQALFQLEQYPSLYIELEKYLENNQIQRSRHFFEILKLQNQVIQHLALSDAEAQQLQQNIMQMALDNAYFDYLEKTEFYLDLGNIFYAKQAFILFKKDLIYTKNNSFGFDERLKKKYKRLFARWEMLDHPQALDLFIQLFNLESEFIQTSKNNNYEYLFSLLQILKIRQQKEVIDKFLDFAHTYLAHRKALLRRLEAEFSL